MPPKSRTVTLPNGEELELFYIGTLAYELGRTPGTVRKWEIAGYIPETCFKDASTGRRLYSREQIDAIVKCAERAKVKQGMCISDTCFAKWCHQEMNKIKEKYKGGTK